MIVNASGLGHIDVISPGFVVTLWMVAVAAVITTVFSLSRRRRFLRGAWWTSLAVVLTLLATADSINAHYAYLPTISDVGQTLPWQRPWPAADAVSHMPIRSRVVAMRQGVVVRMPLPADRADGMPPTTNVVYLPPQYFTQRTRRFPVVYLFHGSPGQPADWFRGGQAAAAGRMVAGASAPAIIVAPQLSRSWTDDPECVDGTEERVETHLMTLVIPTVDAAFRTITARSARVFAGMSAGGFCALNLGLRHRDLVGTIIDLSGASVPTHGGGAITLFGGRHNPLAQSLVAANSPSLYVPTLTARPTVRIWLDTGTGDTGIKRDLTALAGELVARGFDATLHLRPGGHTYRVWTAALRESLPWALALDVPPRQLGRPA